MRRTNDPTENDELLARYRRRPSVALRNQLVERYRGLVEGMARNLASRLPSSVDVQDLTHAGVWGLMQAIENYRPERGAFVAFLRPRVRGAMLDELRTMDWLPRLFRRRLKQRDAAAERLRDRLDRDPSDGEIARELGVSENRLHASYSLPGGGTGAGGADHTGRDGAGGANGVPSDLVEVVDDDLESPLEAIHRQELLDKIRSTLQPVEWRVLRLHYLEGKSGREVARELRLSASRICQIHVRVLSRLKAQLASAV